MPTLPYDMQVEYLQSSGTQYIDTGIVVNETDTIFVEAMFLTKSGDNFLIGATGLSGEGGIWHEVYSNGSYYSRFGSSSSANASGGTNAKHSFEIRKNYVGVDGTRVSQPNYTSMPSRSLVIFGRNSSTISCANARIYAMSIKDSNNNARINLIPVRVGQVGYMYDTVSGTLFGNDGTGNFVLGDDLSPYAGDVSYIKTPNNNVYRIKSVPMVGASSSSDGEGGSVPKPSAGDQGKYLCGDGTWQAITEFTGATSAAGGSKGLVPKPLVGEQNRVLFGDGTWHNKPDLLCLVYTSSSVWPSAASDLDGQVSYQDITALNDATYIEITAELLLVNSAAANRKVRFFIELCSYVEGGLSTAYTVEESLGATQIEIAASRGENDYHEGSASLTAIITGVRSGNHCIRIGWQKADSTSHGLTPVLSLANPNDYDKPFPASQLHIRAWKPADWTT